MGLLHRLAPPVENERGQEAHLLEPARGPGRVVQVEPHLEELFERVQVSGRGKLSDRPVPDPPRVAARLLGGRVPEEALDVGSASVEEPARDALLLPDPARLQAHSLRRDRLTDRAPSSIDPLREADSSGIARRVLPPGLETRVGDVIERDAPADVLRDRIRFRRRYEPEVAPEREVKRGEAAALRRRDSGFRVPGGKGVVLFERAQAREDRHGLGFHTEEADEGIPGRVRPPDDRSRGDVIAGRLGDEVLSSIAPRVREAGVVGVGFLSRDPLSFHPIQPFLPLVEITRRHPARVLGPLLVPLRGELPRLRLRGDLDRIPKAISDLGPPHLQEREIPFSDPFVPEAHEPLLLHALRFLALELRQGRVALEPLPGVEVVAQPLVRRLVLGIELEHALEREPGEVLLPGAFPALGQGQQRLHVIPRLDDLLLGILLRPRFLRENGRGNGRGCRSTGCGKHRKEQEGLDHRRAPKEERIAGRPSVWGHRALPRRLAPERRGAKARIGGHREPLRSRPGGSDSLTPPLTWGNLPHVMDSPNSPDGSPERLELTFPTPWTYTIFGTAEEAVRDAVRSIVTSLEHELTFSNASKTGRFLSFQLVVTVPSDEERLRIFRELREHDAVLHLL
ncbi:MAG TPA: DUF493 domain-containing protein [Planctomycetes bacterium]|nr:DUF493 domain-containing protein [Planctomycetota bacterium]